MGNAVFHSCRNLKDVEIKDGVTTIGSRIFSDCESLTHITIPGSVTSIGEYAFSGTKMKNVVIPGSIKNIECMPFVNVLI